MARAATVAESQDMVQWLVDCLKEENVELALALVPIGPIDQSVTMTEELLLNHHTLVMYAYAGPQND